MRDPAAMATHEAEMHGTPTAPAPKPAAGSAAAAHTTALSMFETDDFAGSGLCVMCHEGLVDASGGDVSITTHWRSTMMGNAAKDPAWRAKVASETARNPALKDVIEKKCATCHAPMATTQAKALGQPLTLFGDGFLNPAHPLSEAAQDGVSCTLCHQITADNLNMPKSYSGGYVIDTGSQPPDRLAYGPYKNPFPRPMQMHTGYLPTFGAHTDTAAFCATCHNLMTPYVDAAGKIVGDFPEQMPYTEWQSSAFGKSNVTCQACHMPTAKGGVVISPMPGRLAPREPFFQHFFVGGNRFMLTMLKDNAARAGCDCGRGTARRHARGTGDQLGRGATLALNSVALENGALTVQLQINVATGHKFPTSFPSRRCLAACHCERRRWSACLRVRPA